MKSRFSLVVGAMLLLLPTIAGCAGFVESVLDAFHPQGSSAESGLSRQERQQRAEAEHVREASGAPFTSDR